MCSQNFTSHTKHAGFPTQTNSAVTAGCLTVQFQNCLPGVKSQTLQGRAQSLGIAPNFRCQAESGHLVLRTSLLYFGSSHDLFGLNYLLEWLTELRKGGYLLSPIHRKGCFKGYKQAAG